jgi:hypothetical protein
MQVRWHHHDFAEIKINWHAPTSAQSVSATTEDAHAAMCTLQVGALLLLLLLLLLLVLL